MSKIKRLLLFIGFSLSLTCQSQSFDIYTYHTDPPFLLNDQTVDLSKAWINHFNKQHTDIKLNLISIERPKLNKLIEAKQSYLILWANPIWFKSRDPNVLASDPIFWDSDIWISRNTDKVTYSTPEDLIGLTIGGRKGYYYKGVNPLVKEGKIHRIDQNRDYANYEMLLKGAVKTFVMSRSSYLYWQSIGVNTQQLYTAMSAHDAFTRHVLASQDRQSLLPVLNAFIQSIKADTQWQSQLKGWGVDGLVNPYDIELDELDKLKLN